MPDSSLDPRNLIAHPSLNWKERKCSRCGIVFEGAVERCPRHRGGRRPRAYTERPLPGQPLARRELQIASLVAEDLLNKQIAYRLNMSYESVKTYMYYIMRKLKVQSRVGVAMWYVRNHPQPRPDLDTTAD